MQNIKLALQSIGNISFTVNHRLKWAMNHFDSGEVNASGDKSSTLDLEINDLFINNISNEFWCAAIASEELNSIKVLNSDRDLILVLDPLDGSDNAKVNNSVGTIFGLYKKLNKEVSEEDFLQPGSNLVAAGYILYGSQPTMVAAYNGSVNRIDILTGDPFGNNIICPAQGNVIAVNSGNYPRWDQLTKNWFDTIVEYGKSSFRYSGCMVADFHRILIQGGMFAYPSDRKNLNGKLRLLFECAPLAYVMHMAGGTSTTGDSKTKSILELVPNSLHQPTPVFLGSKWNIKEYFRG